ncbi:MAG: desulfoferrodoxin FeS4 iron-binding domain-containing protein [Deltaproteobacteria bacterium]|nr:desulfoferrodoxin FeS4 iron-binding domain-containing protein [Deltaproteobacteria bacterium]
MKLYQTYRCSACGNETEVQKVGGGTLSCCGQPMELTTKNLTLVNLLKAFAGESQARNKYDYFAKVANKEGYRDIAGHFERAAKNEKSHAKLELALHNRMLTASDNSFGDTAHNLQEAIEGERYEHQSMYPEFAEIAKEEGHDEAARLFKAIGKIEVEHEMMYSSLLKRLQANQEFESDNETEEWICEVCGHVHRGKKAIKLCPVCKHPQAFMSRLNTRK